MTDPTAPDWATSGELACPLCDYNLRGLTEPRCPECGFAFRWAELLDAKRDRHPWLFEHGRGRNVGTFLSTYVRTCFPRRFWRRVTPANPVNVNRLLAYWLVASCSLILIAFGTVPAKLVARARSNLTARAAYAASSSPPVSTWGTYYPSLAPAQVDVQYPAPWSIGFIAQAWVGEDLRPGQLGPMLAIVPAFWPWLSQATLMVFQGSMRRAKVNAAHVLRVTVYGCDFGILLAITVATAVAVREVEPIATMVTEEVRVTPLDLLTRPIVAAVVACATIATYRLTIAYSRYLRFDRPFLTVLASQVIALLLAVGVIVVLQ